MLVTSECAKKNLCYSFFSHKLKVHASLRLVITNRGTQGMNKQVLHSVRWYRKLWVALQRSALQTPKTPKFVKPLDGKRYIRMLGVFLTLLDNYKWAHPQPGKPSIPSRRPLSVQLLPWFYHGNSYWRDRANRNRPKVQERTLRHRSNELCRVIWRPHWPFMQKHLVRPQFATGFQKAPFGRRTKAQRTRFRPRVCTCDAVAPPQWAFFDIPIWMYARTLMTGSGHALTDLSRARL